MGEEGVVGGGIFCILDANHSLKIGLKIAGTFSSVVSCNRS
jgi:hypothetical protein